MKEKHNRALSDEQRRRSTMTEKYRLYVRALTTKAEQGDAEAQNSLGVMYENGNGVVQDDVEAVCWYRLAAAQGYASAQNNLGFMYDHGLGVEQDYVEAKRWFRLADEQVAREQGEANEEMCVQKAQKDAEM